LSPALHRPAAPSPINAFMFDLPKIGSQYFVFQTTDGKTNNDVLSPALHISDPSSIANVLAPLIIQKSDHIFQFKPLTFCIQNNQNDK
jgi:hypothetical protein